MSFEPAKTATFYYIDHNVEIRWSQGACTSIAAWIFFGIFVAQQLEGGRVGVKFSQPECDATEEINSFVATISRGDGRLAFFQPDEI